MQELAVVALITALPPRQAMFDEPAPVLALRKPFDLRSGEFEWPGSLRWPQPQARRTHFCIDMVGEPAARLLVDFRQPFPGKFGGGIDDPVGLLGGQIDGVMGARQIVHPVLEDDGPASQIRQVTEGNDPLSQRADVLESRGEFSEAADLANLNENRRRELPVAIEPAANVARDAEVQLVAAD